MAMNKSLKNEIRKKAVLIRDNPQYYLKRDHQIRHSLISAAKTFSWVIEHPEIRREILASLPLLDDSHERGEAIRRLRTGVERIGEAWRYLSQHPDPYTSPVLVQIAQCIEPNQNKGGYRDHRVSLNLKSFVPPNPLKIPELVEDTFARLRTDTSLDVVERAAYLHLRLAGIQPFPGGNKRTARLYQDGILYKNGLPPAVIPSGEREIYFDLLEPALVAHRDGTKEGLVPFFDYIGGKVNTALDSILNDLHVKPTF